MRTYSKSLNPIGIMEGEWTPVLWDDSLSDGEGQTYSIQVGRYTKIGNRVLISGHIKMTSGGTLSIGQQANIGGLPFTSNSTTNTDGGIACSYYDSIGALTPTGVGGVISPNTNYIKIYEESGSSTMDAMSITGFGSSGEYIFTGQYIT